MKTRLQHAPSGWQVFWRTAGHMAAGLGLFVVGVLLGSAVCRLLGI